MNIFDTSALSPVGTGTVLAQPTATANYDLAGMFGLATQAIGGIAGAFATDQIGQNNEAYEIYQAEINRINADIKLDQQKDIIVQGQIQIAEQSRQVGEAIADNINAQGGSGFQISEDSINSIQRMGDRQTSEIRKNIENAYLEVGYQALGLETSAAGHELAAKNEAASARSTALTKGLGSVGNAAVKLGAFIGKNN